MPCRARRGARACISSAPAAAASLATSIMAVLSRVLPGMQSAFVDIGLDRAAFLHLGRYLAVAPERGCRKAHRKIAARRKEYPRPGDQGFNWRKGRAAVYSGQYRGHACWSIFRRYRISVFPSASRMKPSESPLREKLTTSGAGRRKRRLHHPDHGGSRQRAGFAEPISNICISYGATSEEKSL